MAEDKTNWAMDFSGFPATASTEQSKASAQARSISSRRAISGSVDTQVGSRSRMQGRFEFLGGAELHGELEGEIIAKGDLILGESASVRATIKAERLKVFGQLEGDVECEERLEAFSGAKIAGNIVCPKVVMHDGVLFEGHCDMGAAKEAPVKTTANDGKENGSIRD